MLCQFTFRNFRSYRAQTTFDFQATAIPEFSDSLLSQSKGGNILPVGVIYGPNGGGKSNLLRAFSCLVSTVVKPIVELEKNTEPWILQHAERCRPFLFDDASAQEPTEFEVFFRKNKNEYRYCLGLFQDVVVSESLHWRAIGGKRTGTVFERIHQEIRLGSSMNKASISRSINPKMPYLSFLAINYSLPIIIEVQGWFESCIIRSYANPMVERLADVMHEETFQASIIHALNDVGIDLTGYRLDETTKKFYTHRTIDGKVYELDFEEESEGTKKLIAVLPVFLCALKEGRLLVIDELDAKLHPKLLRYIIALFKNPKINQKGAQLWFTSQDMTTMKNTVFRRDEIWFAAMDENRKSEIYSLYEIRRENNERINSTAAYDKQYLEGRYGADPYLSNMLMGGGWQ